MPQDKQQAPMMSRGFAVTCVRSRQIPMVHRWRHSRQYTDGLVVESDRLSVPHLHHVAPARQPRPGPAAHFSAETTAADSSPFAMST